MYIHISIHKYHNHVGRTLRTQGCDMLTRRVFVATQTCLLTYAHAMCI